MTRSNRAGHPPRSLRLAGRPRRALRARGSHCHALALDVTDPDAVESTLAARGPFQVLVNNAGMNRPLTLDEISPRDLDAIFDLNVKSAFYVSRVVTRALTAAGLPGSIINVSSQMGHVGGPRRTMYCASKHALEGLTKALAWERTHITNADTVIYRAAQKSCAGCSLKENCCPKTPHRKIARSVYEEARDVARTVCTTPAYAQSRKDLKKVEMLFAHLKRILKLDRLRLRGINGAHDEFLLAAAAQNLRRMAKKCWMAPEAIPV